jgi:hypothetical protein
MNNAIVNEFVDYVLSFYGPNELYDLGATREEVLQALAVRLLIGETGGQVPFEGDTVDRELVRDIMIKNREVQ